MKGNSCSPPTDDYNEDTDRANDSEDDTWPDSKLVIDLESNMNSTDSKSASNNADSKESSKSSSSTATDSKSESNGNITRSKGKRGAQKKVDAKADQKVAAKQNRTEKPAPNKPGRKRKDKVSKSTAIDSSSSVDSKTASDPYKFETGAEEGVAATSTGKRSTKVKTEPIMMNDAQTEYDWRSVASLTEPESLGPCEPGTQVCLEGIVWQETSNGVLIVNVTWKGKTYMGTLLDATKHDWSPPSCESPVGDYDSRTPKGRGKRSRVPLSDTFKDINERKLRKEMRKQSGAPNTQPPASPAKSEGGKRKGRNSECDPSEPTAKRGRTVSRNGAALPLSPQGLIECPEPNCGKKYKQPNGLRYHRRNAHQDTCNASDSMSDNDKLEPTSPPETTKKSKRKSRGDKNKNQQLSTEKKLDIKAEPEEKETKADTSDIKPPELIPNHMNTTSVITSTSNQITNNLAQTGSQQSANQSVTSQPSAVPVATITPQVVKPTSQTSDEKDQVKSGSLTIPTSRNLSITPKLLPKSGSNSMAPISTITSQGIYNSLKPIQPKPTILGEATPNPGLNDLRDHKKLKRKRSASRDDLVNGSTSPAPDMQQRVGSVKGDSEPRANSMSTGDAANLLKSPSSYSDISDDGEVRNAVNKRDLQSSAALHPSTAHLVATVSPQKNSPSGERLKPSSTVMSTSSASKLEEKRRLNDDMKQRELDVYKHLNPHYPLNIQQWHVNLQQEALQREALQHEALHREALQRLMAKDKSHPHQSLSPKSGLRKSSPAPLSAPQLPARELDSKASNERYQLLKENMDMKSHQTAQSVSANEMAQDYSMASANQRLSDDASKIFNMYQDTKTAEREHQKQREFMQLQTSISKNSSTKAIDSKTDPARSVHQSSVMPPPGSFVPPVINPLLQFSAPMHHQMNLMASGFPIVPDLAGMKDLAARQTASPLYAGKSDHKIHELERPSKSPRPISSDRLQSTKSGMVLPPSSSGLPPMFGYGAGFPAAGLFNPTSK